MRLSFFILMVCLSLAATAQRGVLSDAAIDEKVRNVDAATPEKLAVLLTKDLGTEREKVRAIFSWMAEHIAYRVRSPFAVRARFGDEAVSVDNGPWVSANDFVAAQVLQSRSAKCDGYARLFNSLCNFAGLKSAVIVGFARADLSRSPVFRCNHTWNAVQINGEWKLIDVTWGSGYTSYRGDAFVKRLDENYFLPSPEQFSQDHFPDDIRWSLLSNPPVPREFKNAPYKARPFGKYPFSYFSPAAGIIDAALGDTIQLLVETSRLPDHKMAPDTLTEFDSSFYAFAHSVATVEPWQSKDNTAVYRYCVTDENVRWLQLVYNKDAVLRYHLRIRKPALPMASKIAALAFLH